MQSLRVIGVDGEHLVVASDSGERYLLPITHELYDAIRRPSRSSQSGASHVSPREIQAHIRRGLSSQEVADLTGETVDYVALFEGPVIAERQYIAQQAQSIQFGSGSTDRDGVSFGQWVRQRLDDLRAQQVTWSAWKEETGWRVEVAFVDNDVDHRATWSFDPRKQLLVPLNDDATVLSQAEPIHGPLIPRLRPVVTAEETPASERFDSEIFQDMPLSDTGPLIEPVPYGKTGPTKPATREADQIASNETADLLEALRRRRGEREIAPSGEDLSRSNHPSTGSIRLVPDDNDSASETSASIHPFPGTGEVSRPSDEGEPEEPAPATKPTSRRGRPEMPSWDDIVFGARPDDDPA